MKKRLYIFSVILGLFLATPGLAQNIRSITPEKRAEILKLLKLTNGIRLANEMKRGIIAALKDTFPDAPPDYWNKLEKRIDVRELLNSFIPIYAQHLSLEDLKQLVAFYQTPAGRHYLAAKEKMVAASAERGKQWAMGWILQVFKELKAKGYTPKSGNPPLRPEHEDKNGIDKAPNS